MKLLGRWAILSFAMWIATSLIPGIDISGGWWSYLWIALVFGLINMFIGNLLRLITLPLTVLTLGIFLLIINTAMFGLTAAWTQALTITGFWSAFFGALIMSIVGGILKAAWKRT